MTNVLGIIPARAGSKGIPNKNIRLLGGKPLLAYTAQSAIASNVIDRLILSTDSETIAEVGRSLGVEVPFIRPPELAEDKTPMRPVLDHAVAFLESQGWSPKIIVLLQPSAPLRKPEHIKEAVDRLKEHNCDSVVSVISIPHIFAPQKALKISNEALKFADPKGSQITRRQQLEPTFARDGTVYAFWRDVLVEKKSIYGDRCMPLILPHHESFNLDTMDDWRRAEALLS